MADTTSIRNSLFSIFTGLKYINSHPKLYKYILIPIAVNILIFFVFIVLLFWVFNSVFQKIGPEGNGFFEVVVKILILIISVLISIYTFNTISGIVNGPFYDSLIENIFSSEGLEIQETPFLLDIQKSIKSETKKLLLSILLFLISLIVGLIPVLGQILFAFVNFVGFLIFNGLSLYDPMWNRSSFKFKRRIETILKNPTTYWPNILLSGFLTNIPLLNLITLPYAITGSILHEMSLEKDDLLKNQNV